MHSRYEPSATYRPHLERIEERLLPGETLGTAFLASLGFLAGFPALASALPGEKRPRTNEPADATSFDWRVLTTPRAKTADANQLRVARPETAGDSVLAGSDRELLTALCGTMAGIVVDDLTRNRNYGGGIRSASLLLNGDFEAPSILGAGQSEIPVGGAKYILTDPAQPQYANSISGVAGWTYATPHLNGTHSDHGLVRRDAEFGLPAEGQSAFINNWNRTMSQTVYAPVGPGDTLLALIAFGTLGADFDAGRAGRFYLVAGEPDPLNPDEFSPGSIILGELSVANPTWTWFQPDVVVGNREYISLGLSYTYQPDDPALELPITVAFRTVFGSVGYTFWDNASLEITPK